MVALYPASRALTAAPFCVTVAFQGFVMRWLPGNVNVKVQPLIVAPRLVIVMLATNPSPH
jgi:hypothetical protein